MLFSGCLALLLALPIAKNVVMLFSGCLALLLALPIAAFPRELPGHKAIQAQRVQETQAKDEKKVEDIKSIKDLPR